MDEPRDALEAPDDLPKDPAPEPTGGAFSGATKVPAPGMLLAATSILEDPHFRDTLVLVCRHDEDGAYGLVLNRVSHMPLREIFENPSGASSGLAGTRRVYIGGPVQPEEMQVLELLGADEDAVPESVALARGVHVGGRWDSLEAILGRPASSLRLFLGYAGWGPGQLEDEITEGAWEVVSTDLRRLLETPEAEWAGDPEALRKFLGNQKPEI